MGSMSHNQANAERLNTALTTAQATVQNHFALHGDAPLPLLLWPGSPAHILTAPPGAGSPHSKQGSLGHMNSRTWEALLSGSQLTDAELAG